MQTAVDCPSCHKKLRLTEAALGREVKCPGCAHTFAAPAAAEQPAESEVTVLLPLQPEELACAPPVIPGVPPPPRPFRAVLIAAEEDPDAAPPEDREDRCPYCRAWVASGALRCPACETALGVRPRRPVEPEEEELPPRRDYEPHRGGLISALGALSIVGGVPGLCGVLAWPFLLSSLIALALGIAAIVMARADLEQMDRHLLDPDGRRNTVTGLSNGWVGIILGLIGVVLGALRIAGDLP